MTQLTVAEEIERLVENRAHCTDAEVLAELEALQPLPDEDDPAWKLDTTWTRAHLFVAFQDLSALRMLRPAALLLLGRACYGDPGEMMRPLRHSLEGLFKPDWDALAQVYLEGMRSPLPGARLWAIDGLGVLRTPIALPNLIAALEDPAPLLRCGESVSRAAADALLTLCKSAPHLSPGATSALRARALKGPDGAYFEQKAKQIEESHPPV